MNPRPIEFSWIPSKKGFRITIKEEAHYQPLRGSSYFKLPPFISRKKAGINTKNDDQQCFKHCINRHRHPTDNHPERVSSLKRFEDELNWEGIEFPMKIKDISIFERQNECIFMNVFGYEKRQIYPIRHSKHENAFDLLFIANGEGNSDIKTRDIKT